MSRAASAASIAQAVAAGEVGATEVFAEHLARHHESDASLNALVQERHAAARVEAEHVDGRIRRGERVGLLAGVPVSVKECFPVKGLVTSLGISSRRRMVDAGDAPIVDRLREAGAVVVGKGNVPQAMYLHETDNPVWGRTNHPTDSTRSPGGSSGGDAALVAAGVVPLAVGTDLAGSIRQPAHACGITGFMPRSAVIGDGGAFDTVPHLTVVRPRVGLLARHVDDLDRGMTALLGRETQSWPSRSDAEESASYRCRTDRSRADGLRPGQSAVGLRVAWWDDTGPLEPSVAVRRGVREAVEHLASEGAEAVRLDGGLAAEAAWLHLAILSADGGADIRRLFAGERPIPPVARLLRLAGLPGWLRWGLAGLSQATGGDTEAKALRVTGPRCAAAFESLLARRQDFAVRFGRAVAAYDALICPVSALPALPHGAASRLLLAAAPCLFANLLDLPAGTVSVTRVRGDEEGGRAPSRDRVVRAAAAADRGSRGLPVGVQVVGVSGLGTSGDPLRAERVVLEVMRLLETMSERR